MEKDKRGFLKRFDRDKLIDAVIGPGVGLIIFALLFLLVAISDLLLIELKGRSVTTDRFLELIHEHREKMLIVVTISLLSGLFLNSLPKIFKKIWIESISTTFVEGFNSISSAIVENLRPVKNSISSIRLDQFLEAASEDEIAHLMPKINSKLHGQYCNELDSFFNSVNANFSQYYAENVPFRKNCHKNITIEDNGKNLTWHEVFSYTVQCLAFRGNVKCTNIPYLIWWGTIAIVKGVNTISELEQMMKFQVFVDNQKLLDTNTCLDVKNGGFISKRESISSQYDGTTLEVRVKEYIDLSKEETTIKQTEFSILDEADSWYIWKTSVPLNGTALSITLPQGYKFGTCNFSDAKIWDIDDERPNKIVANTRGWIYPGIVVFFKWERIKNSV